MSVEPLATGVIPSRDMKPVYVGEYETAELIPKLSVKPRQKGFDIIAWVPNRKVLEDGSIRLSVMVQNFTDEPVTVDVREDD